MSGKKIIAGLEQALAYEQAAMTPETALERMEAALTETNQQLARELKAKAELQAALLSAERRGWERCREAAADLCAEHAGWFRSGNAWALAEAIRALEPPEEEQP